MPGSMRVLFLHGLESGPGGDKVRLLRAAGLDVIAPDMQMSIGRLDRRNSVVRNLLRLRETRGLGLLVVGSLAASLRRRPLPALGGLAVAAAWLAVRSAELRRRALRRSFEACIAIQREAIERHRPDVVLGSSWGGAIAVELVVRGLWRGPTVLLAPAFHRVAERMGSSTLTEDVARFQACSRTQTIVILHDPSDATIPVADSVDLARDAPVELLQIHAGGHRLMGLLEDGSLIEALRRVVG